MEIDINCDVGEGIGNDAAIMPYISSCNIACGFHAGSALIMKRTIDLALKAGVKIGAHPSYPDKANFGRSVMDLPYEELLAVIQYQIGAMKGMVEGSDALLHHVKPHGSLYNQACKDEGVARAVVNAITSIDTELILYAPFNSVLADIGMKEGLTIKYEAFADRAYDDALRLLDRSLEGAVLSDKHHIYRHVHGMITTKKVATINRKELHIEADTICVHGDNPAAVEVVKFLHQKLQEDGIKVI